jgi:hypothetical protein
MTNGGEMLGSKETSGALKLWQEGMRDRNREPCPNKATVAVTKRVGLDRRRNG